MSQRSLGTEPRRGRGAPSNPANRYEAHHYEPFDDGWEGSDPQPSRIETSLTADSSLSVIARNSSPDLPFDRSLNPYRGCEHGCIYCYARPSHAWLGLSPGLDFETRLFYKPDAPELLRRELSLPGYRPAPIALGANTDAWQPAERRLGITRALLEVLREHHHPLTLVTKSALVERDIDLLSDLAGKDLVHAMVSLTTLDRGLARRMEPRAAAPARRLETLRRLAAAGIPTGVMIAPVIPVLTDSEMERLLGAAREAGAAEAAYVLLRLPLEVEPLFREWLEAHAPGMAKRVLNRLRDSRGGRLNDPRFGSRMLGEGPYAELIGQRFRLAHRRLGFPGLPALSTEDFRVPRGESAQLSLF
jgi:DNA repair photolyase